MADLMNPPSIKDVVAGLDLNPSTSSPLPEQGDLLPSTYQGALNTQTDIAQQGINLRKADTSFTDQGMAVFRNMPTVQAAINGAAWFQDWEADPEFTNDRFEARFKEAIKDLPPDYWQWLQGAKSDAQFDNLYARAKSLAGHMQTLGEMGWGGTAANFIAQALDPISFAAGYKMFQMGGKVAPVLAPGSNLGQMGVNAAFGAGAGVSIEALRAVQGYPSHWEDYAMVASAGFILGGMFGPLARNPATAAEAAEMLRIGQATEQKLLAPPPLMIEEGFPAWREELNRTMRQIAETDAERARARATAQDIEMNPVGPSRGTDEAIPMPGEVPQTGTAVATVDDAVNALLDGDVETAISRIPEVINVPPENLPRLAAPETPEAPAATAAPDPAKEFEGMVGKPADAPVPPTLDQALKEIAPPAPERTQPGPLPTPKQFEKNPNFVGDWMGTDGETYRIMSNQKTGMFSVTKVGKGVVGKDIESLPEAMGMVPQSMDGVERARIGDRRKSEKKPIKLQGKYTLSSTDDGDMINYLIRFPGEEAPVGSIQLGPRGSRWEVEYMSIAPEHRGSGLMQKAYDAIEQELGIRMQPSGELLKGGYAYWMKRDPEAVKYHQRVEGTSHYSPRRIWTDIELIKQNLAEWQATLKMAEDAGDSYMAMKTKENIGKYERKLQAFQTAFDKLPPEAKTIEAMQAMFKYGSRADVPPIKQAARAAVQEVLDRILPKGWSGKTEEALPKALSGQDVYGLSVDRIVRVSMAGPDALNTAYHEGLHALYLAGAFTRKEWDKLLAYAKKINAEQRYDLRARYEDYYGKQGATKTQLDALIGEEAIAHMVADYLKGVRFGGIADRMMEKMVNIFRKIRDALGIKGFRTVQDIFEDIDSGVIGGREGSGKGQFYLDPKTKARRPVAEITTLGPDDPHPVGIAVKGYHGTHTDFTKFDVNKSADFGMHFGGPHQASKRVLGDEVNTSPLGDEATIQALREQVAEIQRQLDEIPLDRRTQPPAFGSVFAGNGIERVPTPEVEHLTNVRAALDDQIRILTGGDRLGTGSRTIPVLLDLDNVVTLPDLGGWAPPQVAEALASVDPRAAGLPEKIRKARIHTDGTDALRSSLRELGYDGVRYQNTYEGEGWSYIVWDKGKVRSALDEDFVMMNLGPATRESRLNDPAFRSVRDDTAPRSAEVRIFGFRIPRFDFEAVTGTSRNPISRLLSGHFFNNAVGMEGHRPTPFAAEIRKKQAVEKYLTAFSQTYNPAWSEWARDNGVRPIEWFSRQKEFREQIGMYVADREGLGNNYHPAVRRVGDKVRNLLKEQLHDMRDPGRHRGGGYRPVAGTETIPDDLNYLWRQFDSAKVQNKVNLHGLDTVEEMVSGAIQSAQPWIPQQYLRTLARGYIETVYNHALGLDDVDWSGAISGKDFGRLQSILQRHTQLTPQQIEDVMSRWRTRPPESGMAHTKHKLFLDESHVYHNAPTTAGGTADLAFRDLLNNDIGELFNRYTQRVQGRVALAQIQVRHPDTGAILVNGITSDEEFANLLRLTREYGTDYLRNRDPNFQKILAKDEEYLQFIYDRIKGVPDPRQHTEYAKWLQRIRAFNITRLLGQVGVAQIGEFGQVIGQLGVKATIFGKIPAMRRMVTMAGDSRLRDTLTDEVERMGIGGERLHGMSWHHLSELGDMPFEVRPEAGWRRGLDNALELGQKATFEGSGMAWVQQQELRKVSTDIMSWFSDAYVKRQRTGNWDGNIRRRLAQLGLDEAMADRIGAEMQANASWKQTGPSRRLSALNLPNWRDFEARAAFEETVFRFSRKLIQQHDIGSMAFWMTEPNARSLFQFRSFVFQAWANQFHYNLHMGDFNAFAAMTWGIVWNAMTRALQVYAIAATRSDGDKYKEKYLSPVELGKAGFERSGWSSIIPMLIDTGTSLTGQGQFFGARTTGMSQSIFSNPTFGIIDNAQKGIGGAVDSMLRGRDMSQAEIRAGASLLPLMNQMQFSMLLSTLIKDRPLQAPRQQPLF